MVVLIEFCPFIPLSVTLTIFKGHSFAERYIVQERCESRGGRPGLSVLTSIVILASVDVKIY